MSVPIRLNKVLKELNISLDRAVEFLSSKKINVEPRPTSKIDERTYRLLLDEFQTDKSDKDELEKINIQKRKELEEKQILEEKNEIAKAESNEIKPQILDEAENKNTNTEINLEENAVKEKKKSQKTLQKLKQIFRS